MEGGKFLSLDQQEAKKVLEIYVRRTLSNYEGKTRRQERTSKRVKKLQRSESDYVQYGRRKTAEQTVRRERESPAEWKEPAKVPASGKQEEKENVPTNADKGSLSVKKEKKQTSWLKAIFSFFSKKKEEGIKKTNERDHAPGYVEQERTVGSLGPGKSLKKRTSLRRVISNKQNAPEEDKGSSLEAAAKVAGKPKRPNFLPLQQVHKPARIGKENSDIYCNKVSEEIELIVQEKEALQDGNRKQSMDGDLPDEGELQTEALIRKIAALLQRKGDQWNQKIRDDPKLNSFFQDMSYSTFKQLADVYLDKEVKSTVGERTPEEMKFAFSVHLTAKVAGICNYPVSRVMGFGKQYLEDTFSQFYCKQGWGGATGKREGIASPD
ncbi:uncharacterized protein C6orf222 [Microcaecilia unicolor]|uniref:Uncharacterized protein C6orf222-like n=1 Tax=Microcaecilia unicolor TaxID=1415580 RepID=A0A6P7ZTJ5_9AMPH|nr:uncharacterized protein C6orf222-like [Microcaecilia unicolor]